MQTQRGLLVPDDPGEIQILFLVKIKAAPKVCVVPGVLGLLTLWHDIVPNGV